MPRATVDVSTTERFELDSLPGAFIVLRRMTYGQVLERQSMITMSFVQENEAGSKKKKTRSELSMANLHVTIFEFSKSIVEHNLEDAQGRVLNFTSPADLQSLDPRVGQEVDKLITKYNKLDDDDSEGDGGLGD
jgi:hypothetical protein